MLRSLTKWITTNCEKFLKRWEYQPILPAFCETCMQFKKQQLEHGTMDWFKIRKGVHQGCVLTSCLFNFYKEYIMQNTGLDESQAGLKIARRNMRVTVKITQLCLMLWDPMDYTVHGILQARILEWVAFSLLQGIFPTQGSNPGLPHCRWIVYQLSHKGSPGEISTTWNMQMIPL